MEPFYDINIDADGTVEDSIRLSFKSHMMKYCNVCQSDTSHNCVASVVQQPKISTVIINRFKLLNLGQYTKNTTKVLCNQKLSFTGFSASLVAVIFHKGCTLTSGHYTAMICTHNKWFHCDDDSVTLVTDIGTILDSKEAYILFYCQNII